MLPSRGALDNLQKLANPTVKVDVGFVQGGLADGHRLPPLVSLGSVYPQPLMVYCRSDRADRDAVAARRASAWRSGPRAAARACWR